MPLAIQCFAPGPCYFGSQLNPVHLIHLVEQHHLQHQGLAQGKDDNKILQCAGAPLIILCLIGLVKGMSFGPPHCAGLGFTQHTLSTIFLSLKIPSLTLTNSFSVGHLLANASANHSNRHSTLLKNCVSFHIKPKVSSQWFHINKLSLIQFYILSPLSHTLKIYFHTYSPDFCLNSKFIKFFRSIATSSWTTLSTSPLGACLALSLVRATIGRWP